MNQEENKKTNENNLIMGKGIMDLIREDPILSKKVTFEEAVMMNPSILNDVENGEEILKEIREKYPEPEEHDIDEGIEEALNAYLETIGVKEETEEEVVTKSLTI